MSKYKDITIDMCRESSWKTIVNFVDKNDKVLDIGCSSGYLAQKLKELKNCKVWGVDIDREDVKLAKKNCEEAFVANIETVDLRRKFKKHTFDKIIIADVLEHLMNPSKVLFKVRNVLKKSGYIIVSVPNIAHISVRLNLLRGNFTYQSQGILDNTHTKYFTKKTIIERVRKSGYRIEKISPVIINEVPRAYIELFFKKMGARVTNKTLKILTDNDSIAYQYVIKAQNTYRKEVASVYPSKLEVQKEVDDYIVRLNKQFYKEVNERKELEKRVKELENELSTVRD